MAPTLSQAAALLRRAGRSGAARTGNAERWSELESVFDPGQRRNARDDYATRVLLTGALREHSCAIDIGANNGAILEQIVAVAPEGRHFAFEPIPALADDLRRRFPAVTVTTAALSDVAGTAQFTVVVDAPALSGLKRREDLPAETRRTEVIGVEVVRLDDVVPADASPAFVKVDVEGAEVGVLRGAQQLLAKHRPVVVFEHGSGGADLYGETSGALWDLLDGCGLRIFDLEGRGPFDRSTFEGLFTSPRSWNYAAIPR
ncbi:MAG: FkbM family methyltransferase [Solirubrobacterales bacterium]|nr:FkbM family methyltransferase [Solirubrobacterales bacterium]